jgi:hypothetical protein
MITDALRPLGLRLILRPYDLAGFKHLSTRACVLGNHCTIHDSSLHSASKKCQLWPDPKPGRPLIEQVSLH